MIVTEIAVGLWSSLFEIWHVSNFTAKSCIFFFICICISLPKEVIHCTFSIFSCPCICQPWGKFTLEILIKNVHMFSSCVLESC
uniref:Uncharacterized protein n=1 Tax=Rhizophora mucronata TaxID=61149 RepID=A0A2P2NH30_RHIMU